MKRMLLVLLALVFISPMISIGAEKDSISVKLVWEKEIPKGVNDFVFLDENGYNVFSVQCKNPEKALKEKRLLMVQGNKLVWYEGDAMRVVKEMTIKGSYAISKNGHNIAVLEGLKRNDKGSFEDKPATLRLLNWKGEELARTQFSPGHLDYIDLFSLGNDSTVILNLSGGEGLYYTVWMFLRNGSELKKVFSSDGYIWTYAENGSIMLVSELQKKRLIMDGSGKNVGGFLYNNPRGNYWAGISPKGNYIAEVTTGKSVVIHNKYGTLISEHHVQGQGNYYGAFSPDEKYLCMTPGPWRVYFFETKTGKMLWEYTHPDSFILYMKVAVSSQDGYAFVYSQPWSCPSPDREINPKPLLSEKSVHIFDKKGNLINLFKIGDKISSLRITSDGEYLMVRLPSKLQLYHIIRGGKDETN
ncbi:hypothetical protein DRP44_01360 [candidate division TA06 bacterium]|uniref:WD40 repeat domain-containing protein n=1 Tax=candidate division TA06 bacterium TaxID=2250710 RepID=A0A660SCS7_UNCT6|nr:MAG: hypothetical protein DRP44_01360 [candidate division TA06 bacterium]